MAKKLIIPTFTSETADADWHESHKRVLEQEIGRRIRSGNTKSVASAKAREKRALRPVTIRLPMEDINSARELAAQKGLGYETYIGMLLRETLHRRAQSRVVRKRRRVCQLSRHLELHCHEHRSATIRIVKAREPWYG